MLILCMAIILHTGYAVAGKEHIVIVADKAIWDKAHSVTTLSGNVKITHDVITLYADTIQIFGDMNNIKCIKGRDGIKVINTKLNISITADNIEFCDIKKQIILSGNVKLGYKDFTGTADKAMYQHVKNMIVLTGSPVILQGKNKITGKITGKKIIYHIQQDRVEIIKDVRIWWKW
jgi:lipopolysaccharide export system protein LptA